MTGKVIYTSSALLIAAVVLWVFVPAAAIAVTILAVAAVNTAVWQEYRAEKRRRDAFMRGYDHELDEIRSTKR